MVAGFFLLALVGAAPASLFVRADEQPVEDIAQADPLRVLLELREFRAERAQMRAQQAPIDVRSLADAGSRTHQR